MVSIADGHAREKNNFDLLRLMLASTVFLVHSHVLSQAGALAWFSRFLSTDFAIKGFFAVSGYLIFMSFENSRSLADYLGKRARRILPAYVFVIVAAVAIGAMITAAPMDRYLAGARQYLLANLLFLNFLAPTLPGVFAGNPEHAINGALWTLKIEVIFYFSVPVIVWLLRRYGKLPVLASCYILSSAYAALLWHYYETTGDAWYAALARQFPGQLAYFIGGAVLYYTSFDLRSRLGTLLAAISLAYVAVFGSNEPLASPLAIGCLAIWFAKGLPFLGNAGRYGDFSYGIYILHFPILQVLVQRSAFAIHPWLGFIAACIVLVIAAALLWHSIEQPFLKRTSHYRSATAGLA